MSNTQTAIVVGVLVVVALFAIYEMTRPPPQTQADVSWQQAGQLIAMYYGL